MAEQGFTLTSPDFVPDGIMLAEQTCDGDNRSPTLEWIHSPEQTRSFALILEDVDAPDGVFTHWVLFDIPGESKQIPQNGNVGIPGRNDFQHPGYGGPCPPPKHDFHRYYFRLFALDIESLGLEPNASRLDVENAIAGHILDEAELMGRYKRTAR